MVATPMFVYLSLRYDVSSATVFSDSAAEYIEECHIIPIYDCYYSDAPQGKRGDEYCHYYLRNYLNRDSSGRYSIFFDLIDPKLKICCRNGELFYSDSNNKFFQRLEMPVVVRKFSDDSASNVVIGTLEQMNITM